MGKRNIDLSNFRGTGQGGIIDKSLYEQAGINIKTRMPTRISDNPKYENLRRMLRIIDEQDAVNRYKWGNLPTNIVSQEIERLLYYKGQLVFFKFQDEYFLMPYALNGGIDFYGRFKVVKPVPYATESRDEKDNDTLKLSIKAQEKLLGTLQIAIVYDVNQLKEGVDYSVNAEQNKIAYGVILRDYINQLSQTNIPRWQINDVLCDLEAECLCYLNTSMAIGSGISGVRVPDTDSMSAVIEGAMGLKDYALKGIPWVPIKGSIEFQELENGSKEGMSEYFLAFQSLDNLRLSTYGLDNTGVFEKQSHILNDENQINQQRNQLINEDSLTLRKKFAEIANKVFGLNMTVERNDVMTEALGSGNTQSRDVYNRVFVSGGDENNEND